MSAKLLRIVVAIILANAVCQAQQETASAPHFAAGIKLSSLGIGGEAAIPFGLAQGRLRSRGCHGWRRR